MKGQAGLEYIYILGLVLVVTAPLFFYGISKSNEFIRISQTEDAVKTIVNTADIVYSSGLGGKDTAVIAIPSGVVSGGVYKNIFVLNLSLYGGITEFFDNSKANLSATADFLDKIKNRGTYHVNVESFRDQDGTIKVLLGGFCGDKICGGTENFDNCNSDCISFCPDSICSSNENCGCSDCYGLQDGCSINQVCDAGGSGNCVPTIQVICGDGICTGVIGDNCKDCSSDCPVAAGYVCCAYDPLQMYYVLLLGTSCPEIPPSVSNCGDYCNFIGSYDKGWCRQNPSQCTKYNEVYKSEGDLFCSGSPTGDACCCVPE